LITRDEIIKVLTILKTAYPKYYANMTKEEAENTIALYYDMFKDDDSKLLAVAVKNIIVKLTFPPAIAEIKNEMYKLKNNEETPIELWNKLKKAITNSTYNSVEEFNKLPKKVQRFIGSPNSLRELAMNDSTVNDTVVKGQFLKQIETIIVQEKEEQMMLPEIKTVLQSIGKDVNSEVKKLGGTN
jgi:hypothetical protein